MFRRKRVNASRSFYCRFIIRSRAPVSLQIPEYNRARDLFQWHIPAIFFVAAIKRTALTRRSIAAAWLFNGLLPKNSAALKTLQCNSLKTTTTCIDNIYACLSIVYAELPYLCPSSAVGKAVPFAKHYWYYSTRYVVLLTYTTLQKLIRV